MDSLLFQAFVYLLAAVIAVPVATRLRLGSVLGYLLAGIIIGPHLLNLVGDQSSDVMHFAEFGVVMMLFLVGLELEPSRLWGMRTQLLGLGGLQVLGTAVVIAGVALLAGVSWQVSVAAGFILSMSSTAIVLQSLQERGQMKTPAGEASFAVLLFQDIAVIPILALLPLLATGGASPSTSHASGISALPAWQHTTFVILAVVGIVFIGRNLINPLFRAIARTGQRELFTAAALLLVIGIALIMQLVGLSAALGTFVAGVVLANSEYRHELEADIEPFKGLLLGLFFITVGANIDFVLLRAEPGLIAALVLGLIGVKFVVLLVLSRTFRLSTPEGLLFSFALAQGGEFAFVLLSFVVEHQVLSPGQASPLIAAVALSMAATPLLFVLNDRFVQPRFARARRGADRAADPIDAASHDNPVIIAGFGRFGHIVGRLLRANGIGTTVLDLDAEQVEIVRKLGIKVFYGDATRIELLHAAGAARARVIVIAIDNEQKAVALAETVQHNFPNLKIFARAVGRVHAYEFQKRGIQTFYRETVGSSLDLGFDVMRELGFRHLHAQRATLLFKRHDEQSVRELAQFWEDDDAYFRNARQHIEAFEQMFASDSARRHATEPVRAPADQRATDKPHA